MLVVVTIAYEPPMTLWSLLVIKFELLIQLSPAFVLGTLIDADDPRAWSGRDIQAGLLAGLIVSLALYAGGLRSWGGFHAGTIGVAVNYLCAVSSRRLRLGRAA